MKNILEKLGDFIGLDPLVEGVEVDQAKTFLEKGILPNGDKWSGKPPITVGFDGEVITKKVLKKEIKGGTRFTFEFELKPGKAGGGGATIPAAASNHYFNIAGTDKKNIAGMKAAFLSAVKSNTKGLGANIHKWLSNMDNWVWRVTGWSDRKNWAKPSLKIVKISASGTMIDPTRRKWPSGRTEIWVPLTVVVQADMRRK